ncbi:MAG: AraC family transcriptional regulator [Victivallales bacterium]
MDKISTDRLQKIIDDTLTAELQTCTALEFGEPRYGRWVVYNIPSFTMVTRGRAVTEFRNNKTPLKRFEGSLCCIPGGMWRRTIISEPKGADFCLCRCLYTVFNGFNLLSLYDIPDFFSHSNSLRFAKIHRDLLRLNDPGTASPFETAARRKELCFSLLNLILAESRLKPEAFNRIRQLQRFGAVVKYLNKHFCETVSIDTLAELAFLSKSQFHRQFKTVFGSTPFEYLKKLRLQNALKLLQHSDLSILEVGEQSGWNDQFHFSRIFKSAIGLSPGNYRKNIRSDLKTFLAGF